MEHIVSWEKEIQPLVQSDLRYEFPLQPNLRILKQEMAKPGAGLLESMVEQEIKPFHQKSKNDVRIIYDLSQEVYYRHNDKNPELAKLAASLFLFFSDFGYYLKIEDQHLIPVVRNLIEKVKHSMNENPVGRLIQELKNRIQREHYSFIDKLKYFRVLTDDYRMPEGAGKSYKLLFDKLNKFEYDLVMYIHFESNRFFPLAIEMENYLSENKFNYYGKVKKFNGKTDWL